MGSYFASAGEPPDDRDDAPAVPGLGETHASLPYRVEVWNPSAKHVEQVVALTKNRSVGWAAFYETTQQFPDRLITFRDPYGELSRWNPRKH